MGLIYNRPWTRQPPFPARLAPLPITPEFAWLGSSSGIDLAKRKSAARSVTGADLPTPYGVATPFIGATTNALTFAGGSTAAQTKVTFAAVFDWDSTFVNNNFVQLLGLSASNTGFRVSDDGTNSGKLCLVKGGVAALSAVQLVTGVPYAMVCSHRQDTGEYYLLCRALDGSASLRATQTETSASSAGDGTFGVGIARTDYTGAWNGRIAMAFASFDFLPEMIARQWVNNLWQLFAPLPRRVWAPTSATYPVLSAATVTAITSTGATPRVTITI